MSAIPTESSPHGGPEAENKSAAALELSVNRIKSMIKQDVEVKSISTEACFAVAKATQLLVADLTQRGARVMFDESRDTLDYKDVAGAVEEYTGYDFLDDVIPQKIPAAVAVARMLKKNPVQQEELPTKKQQQVENEEQ
ncbi:hypothetical protein Ndes2437B_g06751 [Nannochloris sp. 'desiccata']